MNSTTCPRCEEAFTAAGAVRDHAWDAHGACHYCGDVIDGDDEEELYTHWLASHPDDLTTVDYKRASATVGTPTFSDRLSGGGVGAAVGGLSRRRLLIGGGATTAAALGVGGVLLTGGSPADAPPKPGDGGPVASAPLPEQPGDHRYATMGTAGPDATVTYYGNWKCPYCAQFSTGFLEDIVTEYVQSGDVNLRFRGLAYINGEPFLGPDAPRAARAGLAVWNVDPASYWRFHEYVFANQPPERERWATTDRLVSFAEAVGVSAPDQVRTALENGQYQSAVEQTSQAAADAGVAGTPALVIDGETVNPLSDEQLVRTLIGRIGE